MRIEITEPSPESAKNTHFWPETGEFFGRSRGQETEPLIHIPRLMLPLPRARNLLLCCGLFCALTGGAVAQSLTPLGAEFSLSGEIAGDQMLPAAALGANGGWLVWQDNRIDRFGTGIGARRVDASLQGAGSVVKVNKTTIGDQDRPAVALLANGGAAVAWQSGLVPGLSGVYARFLTPAGGFASAEIKVSSATASLQRRYVTNLFAYLNNKLIKRRFAIRETVRVTRDMGGHPAVTALADGSVVIAYDVVRTTRTNGWRLEQRTTLIGGRSYLNDVLRPFSQIGSWGHDVFLRRFSATGQPLGPEVQVNQFALNHQRYPALTVLSNGHLVVSWISEEMVNNILGETRTGTALEIRDRVDVMARVFDDKGQPLGDEFTVNTAAKLCASPTLAPLADGGFVAAWSENTRIKPDSWDVWARAFQADGTTSQDAFRVNTYTVGDQYAPRVASAGAQQLVVWASLGQDGSFEGVYARLLSGGMPVGDEFRVNTTTPSKQMQPDVVAGPTQGFLAVWAGMTQLNAFDIFGQAYSVVPAPAGSLASGPSHEGSATGGGAATTLSPAGLGAADLLRSTGVVGGPGSGLRVALALNRHARELRWNATPGGIYQVQISTNLTVWTNLGEPRTAAAATDMLSLTGGQAAAFFRVIQVR